MKKKQKTNRITIADYLKASRQGARLGQRELLGDGFHAVDRPHRSKKIYTRKRKHPHSPD